jgi:putative transposase
LFTITVRRKLIDDLRDQGERVSENRVARLASLAGILAQVSYKRRPERYGGKPAVVTSNTLDRQFDVDAPDRVCLSAIAGNRLSVTGDRHHLQQDL